MENEINASETQTDANESNEIRVMVIKREVATNQLSVCEFFCEDMEDVAAELKSRYKLIANDIAPVLDEDDISYAGLIDRDLYSRGKSCS